jgi:electron transfer flavoprotein beta subunit
MKVLAAVNQIIDHSRNPMAKADGAGVDLSSVKLSMNPCSDKIASDSRVHGTSTRFRF